MTTGAGEGSERMTTIICTAISVAVGFVFGCALMFLLGMERL